MACSSATFDHTEQLLFATSLDKTAKLWNLKNNKLLTTFTGHIGTLTKANLKIISTVVPRFTLVRQLSQAVQIGLLKSGTLKI